MWGFMLKNHANSLIAYQKSEKISPATGNFGSLTRKTIKQLFVIKK